MYDILNYLYLYDILDTTIRSSFNNCQLRERNHYQPKANGYIANGDATDLTYSNTKGYERVSKGLAVLCIFLGCTSVFLLHTRSGGNLPWSEEDSTQKQTSQKNEKSWFEEQAGIGLKRDSYHFIISQRMAIDN